MRFNATAVAALGCLAFAAAPAPAIVLDAVTVRAASGQAYDGFVVDPGDTHAFLLEDFAPQLVSISLKAAKGSALLPDLTLRDPSNVDVTDALVPFRKDGTRSVTVKNASLPSGAGRYTLRVTGKTSTTGEYLLKVTAKVVRTLKGSGLVAVSGGTDDFAFFAPTESISSLKVVHGTGSTIVPKMTAVSGSACVEPALVAGLKPGTATLASPVSGTYSVTVTGDANTAGAFNWIARVKPAKPSKKPMRVNGGASFVAAPGPAPAARVASSSGTVAGFGTDGVDLCWREVKTTGGGPNANKNSVSLSTVTGKSLPGIGKNFATDAAPVPRAFHFGVTHAAAVSGGDLYAIPLNGGSVQDLATVAGVSRVLCDAAGAYVLQGSGIHVYPYGGGGPGTISANGGGPTYRDMAFGAIGIVFAMTTGGGDLEVRMVTRTGTGEVLLATLSPDPGFQGLAVRGPDVYFAVSDGASGAQVYRASACDPGSALPVSHLGGAAVDALGVDDLAVYALQEDPTDGLRLLEMPRGGGEGTVILRGNPGAGFDLDYDNLEAAGGYVYLLAGNPGSATFYRVKRR